MTDMAVRNTEKVPNWRLEDMFDLARQNYNITHDVKNTAPNRSGANERDETPLGVVDESMSSLEGAASTSDSSRIAISGIDVIRILIFSSAVLFGEV
mmetsp:Transcript_3597/g.6257  ORF Transcript_3597/g.6257 Transcript_3597/m.6257 type:complete len:97 (-) Transcript_3597:84-374(-)